MASRTVASREASGQVDPDVDRLVVRRSLRRKTRQRRRARQLSASTTVASLYADSLKNGVGYVWRTNRPMALLLGGGIVLLSARFIAALAVFLLGPLPIRESTAVFSVVELLVLLPVSGYLVLVLRDVLGSSERPRSHGWRRIARVGVDVTLIGIAFQLFIQSVVALLLSVPVDMVLDDANLLVTTPGSDPDVSVLTGYVYTIVGFYIYPALIVTYARRERLTDVLPWSSRAHYGAVLSNRTYVVLGGVLVGLQFVRTTVLSPVVYSFDRSVPELVVYWLIGSVVSFYILVVMFYVLGDRWKSVAPAVPPSEVTLDKSIQTTLDVYE